MRRLAFFVWIAVTAWALLPPGVPHVASAQQNVEVAIDELRYDSARKAYFVSISISDPYEVSYLIVNVKDEDAGHS